MLGARFAEFVGCDPAFAQTSARARALDSWYKTPRYRYGCRAAMSKLFTAVSQPYRFRSVAARFRSVAVRSGSVAIMSWLFVQTFKQPFGQLLYVCCSSTQRHRLA